MRTYSVCHSSVLFFSSFQSAPMNAWPGGQQVLVGPFQQIPGLTAAAAAAAAGAAGQRPVPQQILPENLAAPAPQQVLPENWRQSIVLDGFDQTPLAQLVSVDHLVHNHFNVHIRAPDKVRIFISKMPIS